MPVTRPTLFVLSFVLSTWLPTARGQGTLTPPGAPAPSMKTLYQIEPRISVDAVNTPGAGNYQAVISQPGSYYLTGNIAVSGNLQGGIDITVAGVTLDLNGFQISGGGPTSGSSGIRVESVASNCAVRNGSITAFQYGLLCVNLSGGGFAQDGRMSQVTASGCSIGLVTGNSWQADGCRASNNVEIGLRASHGSLVSNCVANANGVGIASESDCNLNNCVANYNTGNGISTDSSCSLTNCIANQNGGAGISGIDTTNVIGCVTSRNGGAGITASSTTLIKNCSSGLNGADGIDASYGSSVIECSVGTNALAGVNVDNYCHVLSNTAIRNATGFYYTTNSVITGNLAAYSYGHGLAGLGINNRVIGNSAIGNGGVGMIQFDATADFVMHNVSNQNVQGPYLPVTSGQYFGPYSTPGSPSASPWSNF